MTSYQALAVIALAWFVLAVFVGLTLSGWIRRINSYTPEPAELLRRPREAA